MRKILLCSRWVTDWTLDSVPEQYLTALLNELTVDRNELQSELSQAKHEEREAFGSDSERLQSGQITRALEGLYALRRQELRLSRILKYILEDPRDGYAIVLQYHPRTKYETLVLPMIQHVAAQNVSSDPTQREMRVAQLIPKIYRKYFPARRGRFLVDFIRELFNYDLIKETLGDIYQQRKETYGVGLYAPVIDQLLR